jgi:hypothetical protein
MNPNDLVRRALTSAQTLIGLNLLLVAISYLSAWLYLDGRLNVYDLTPEQVGVTTQGLLIRAALRATSVVISGGSVAAAFYLGEVLKRRGAGRVALVPAAVAGTAGVGLYLDGVWGDPAHVVLLITANYMLAAAMVYLLVTGLMRGMGGRVTAALVLVVPLVASGLVSNYVFGEAEGLAIAHAVVEGELDGLALEGVSGFQSSALTVPIDFMPYVRFQVADFTPPEGLSPCGLLLGINGGATFLWVPRYGAGGVSASTLVFPTDGTILTGAEGC